MARRSSIDGSPGGWFTCCLPFLLKLLAFLQAFAGVSAVLYAAWILSRWARHHQLHLHDLLPDLWFPSAVMAAGLFYILILLAGYLAAEINSGCCLCFYTIPAMAMLLLEAALAVHLMLNQHWIQDLPYDRTGELDNLLSFIHNNLDLCKWAALALFATQALSLFLAMILRAMLSARSVDYDSDEDFVVIRRPLLVAQAPPPYLPTTVDARGFRPDLWSSRMRQKKCSERLCTKEPKCSDPSPDPAQAGATCTGVPFFRFSSYLWYGLNSSDYTYGTLDPNAPPPQ